MSYCLNPSCPNPQNPTQTTFCLSCGSKLLLKERYRAIKPIGQGGFGKTFLAVDEDKPSKPRCVIKQFFPQAQGTSTVQKAAELFTQEAVRLDELGKHPQIPDLLAYFSQDNQQYLVQEFIEGQDLGQELVSKGMFNEAQINALLNNLLPVLQFVHQHQVIHRDIKPENIIRRNSDQQLFLVDFGASKVATGNALAKTGTVIGSMGYVAPEQSVGKAVFASDIYSLGVTCIHLLTGMHPFDLFDVREGTWVWRNALKHPVSKGLGNILDKMLEGATNRRYPSAAEVLKDLHPQTPQKVVAKPQKPVASPPPPPVKAQPPVTKSISQIDAELAQLKSEVLGTSIPKSPPSKSPSQKALSVNPSTPNSQIDRELEELKSQFGGSANAKQPPS
ncbi:MAG TPA: serine/threonine protein kinase [Cyanobacteria bacterium UBA11370]|nr:serine/threonine protein kinase [Cyanobacteria bacterium UBA11370]HBY78705.1 serine/threonine protein kinase [Cyanobacteria bacterium UBA11148]